jgi:hypothetical protein
MALNIQSASKSALGLRQKPADAPAGRTPDIEARIAAVESASSLSDLTSNPLILLNW